MKAKEPVTKAEQEKWDDYLRWCSACNDAAEQQYKEEQKEKLDDITVNRLVREELGIPFKIDITKCKGE